MADSTRGVDAVHRSDDRASFWRTHLGGAIAVAVTSAALGIIGGYFIARVMSTGDEAPIRVKNGSIELQLLSTFGSWQQAGDHYKTGGTRSNDRYQILLAAQGCPARTSGRTVRLTYSDSHYVELDPTGHHTKVTSDATLTIDPTSRRLLTYNAPGFIKSISVDGTVVCTLNAAGELDDINFLDY